jgi:hypothetical protein
MNNEPVPDGRSSARRPDGTVADLVLAHLAAYPDAEFTPMELHRVLGPSRGAIIRACHRLTRAGHIRRTGQAPQRYQANQTNPAVDEAQNLPGAATVEPGGDASREGENQ